VRALASQPQCLKHAQRPDIGESKRRKAELPASDACCLQECSGNGSFAGEAVEMAMVFKPKAGRRELSENQHHDSPHAASSPNRCRVNQNPKRGVIAVVGATQALKMGRSGNACLLE